MECLSSGGGVAVAMGVARTKEASRQIAMVCLDELVSEDDRDGRLGGFRDGGAHRARTAMPPVVR